MDIYALSGSSGTGKSTSALTFAYQKNIPAIIDDGLLILNGQKVAGVSAKFEKNYIAAVKRATFFDEQHSKEIQQAIHSYFIGKILIIGTSDKMVQIIANRLQLGKIKKYYYVEDIRSSTEIKIAQYVRKTEGKHVIPIPFKQVDQNFFSKIIYKGIDIISPKKERIGETTIVHPDFHKGSIKITQKVFKEIVEYICSTYKEVEQCDSISINLLGLPTLKINLKIKHPIKYNIFSKMEILQRDIHQHFINNLDIELYSINLHINKAKKQGNSNH